MKAWFLRFFGSLGTFLSTLLSGALKQELEVVLPIALKAVKAVAADQSLLSSGAKRDAALASIIAELGKAQLQIGLSVMNLAVELAVQEYKTKNPAIVGPDSGV